MTLEDVLRAHRSSEPREETDRLRMVRFARDHPNGFDRAITEGHFTGSGLVMSEDGASVLLLFHAKLQKWLQPGGHGEAGETLGEQVASREVAEETGLTPRLHPSAPRPFDLDIHKIPARKQDPEHEHLDLRYLFLAHPNEALRAEGAGAPEAPTRNPSLRWFSVVEALSMGLDPGLERMIRKAVDLMSRYHAPTPFKAL